MRRAAMTKPAMLASSADDETEATPLPADQDKTIGSHPGTDMGTGPGHVDDPPRAEQHIQTSMSN